MTIRTGRRDSKIQDGEDDDVLRSLERATISSLKGEFREDWKNFMSFFEENWSV